MKNMERRNYKKVSEHISKWIGEYASGAGIDTLVIGVSGGVDSAVVSTLCAMSGLRTIAVEMPIKKVDDTKGVDHINWLQTEFGNVQREYVDLYEPFNSLVGTLSSSVRGFTSSDNYGLAFANMASRLRMVNLYSIANIYSGLVVGTGNKVEDFGIGFFTVGGDGQVDISPIGDLKKSEVYELGRYLGIDDAILDARPTDGLWDDGRTDEDQIGATYDELEWAMEQLPVDGVTNKAFLPESLEMELTERQKVVANIYIGRHNKNIFKMIPIPICKIPDKF